MGNIGNVEKWDLEWDLENCRTNIGLLQSCLMCMSSDMLGYFEVIMHGNSHSIISILKFSIAEMQAAQVGGLGEVDEVHVNAQGGVACENQGPTSQEFNN